jgi:hypothetical protein
MEQSLLLLDDFTWRSVLGKYVEADMEAHTRRSYRRYRVAGRVIAEYRLNEKLERHNCHILNLAAEGLLIFSTVEMPVGVWVDLQIELGEDNFLAIGMTCHCTQTIGGYKVGVRLVFR